MPNSAPKPCIQCGTLVRDGTSRCAQHKTKAGSFADKRRGSRHERGYGTAWDRIRERILRRDCGICQPCARQGFVHVGTQVDHIVPKSRGGTDDDDNLQVICAAAHKAKTQAEARGETWTGGDQIPGAGQWRTDPKARFSRAGVFGGGVSVPGSEVVR